MKNVAWWSAKDFTATSSGRTTAEDKAKFANILRAFVESGFDKKKWSKRVYDRLSHCYGHIAHYDVHGFWSEWFGDDVNRLEWVRHVLGWTIYGDPAFTYSDVEKVFQAWLRESSVEKELARKVACRKEDADRKALRTLMEAYPDEVEKWR